VRKSISRSARDLKVLRRLAMGPFVATVVIGFFCLMFAFLPVAPWFGAALWTGAIAAIVLGWWSTRGVLIGSTLIIRLLIGIAALMFLLGLLLLVAWRHSRSGDSLDALAPDLVVPILGSSTILAVSSCWALRVARRLHSRFPDYPLRPHVTRRLSVPRDARALSALGPALLGGLQVLPMLAVAIVLAPVLRQQAIPISASFFMPTAFRHFRRVRAILALRAQEVRVADRRLPVLLLRSFADDELAMERTTLLSKTYVPKLSLEEQIVAQLWEVGPVVAIGQPALEVDPIGAARERIVGPLWQPRVHALIEECALVVVVLGQTEGLFWEYQQLARRSTSVLAILPPSDANVLAERWKRFMTAYPPAQTILLEEAASELPLLAWFCADREPLIVSGQPRDERSYELAFMLWRQARASLTASS
jgi:hypothetical protein